MHINAIRRRFQQIEAVLKMSSKLKCFFSAVVFISIPVLYVSVNFQTWQTITSIINRSNSTNGDGLKSLYNWPEFFKNPFSEIGSHILCTFSSDTERIRNGIKRWSGWVNSVVNNTCYKPTEVVRRVNESQTVTDSVEVKVDGARKRNLYIHCPRTMGRLGNQMFQVAATVGIAHAMNYKPVISPSHPLVKYFRINVSTVQPEDTVTINEDLWRNSNMRSAGNCIKDYNLTLDGYFQAWTYFANIPETIRKVFTIRSVYLNQAKAFVGRKQEDSTTLVGIHVRRGDFLRKGEQDAGFTVANKYYISEAIKFYRNSCGLVRFIVCSDDLEWSRSNIREYNVSFSPFQEPVIDMAIMSLCDHVIITSGTFSWWSGWLSGGQVVYLRDYPRPGSKLANDLIPDIYYPPAWVGLSNNKTSTFPQVL